MADRSRWAALLALGSAVCAATSCGDDDDHGLEEACRVLAEECKVIPSVGDCIDEFASQSPACFDCIVKNRCDFETRCNDAVDRCRLLAGPDGGSRAQRSRGDSQVPTGGRTTTL